MESNKVIWQENSVDQLMFPKYYRIGQVGKANVDLLKTLLTNPQRAIYFPFWIYGTLFLFTLTIFSLVHSTLVILTANFSHYESSTFLTGVIRNFSSTMIALFIAIPGVILMWVITPNISFTSTLKRFLFYYQTVLLFSLLGEIFFCKFIIDSSMKLQPFIVVLAGGLAVYMLQKSLAKEPNIRITKFLIVGILCLSYLQAFMIVDSFIPYYLQDNINSPLTIFNKKIFEIIISR